MHLKSKQVPQIKELIPGQKLCKRCNERLNPLLDQVKLPDFKQVDSSQSSTSSQSISQGPVDMTSIILQQAGSIENVLSGHGSFPKELLEGSECTENVGSKPSLECEGEELLAGPSRYPSSKSISPVSTGSKSVEESQDLFAAPKSAEVSQDLFADDEAFINRTLSTDPAGSSSEDPTFVPNEQDAALGLINASLQVLNVSPVNKRKLSLETTYGNAKLRRIDEKFESLMEKAGANIPVPFEEEFFTKTLAALKEKYMKSEYYSVKVAVLSIALVSMSQRRVEEEFKSVGATEHIVRKTVQLMSEQDGILPTLSQRKGRSLPQTVVDIVTKFYELDDISSRQMPGMKDCVSVKVDGERALKQKRLILNTLQELFKHFKKEYPDVSISFSKFASLRPKHCVLAGSSGTHSVCVCKYHQNFKLLVEAGNFSKYDGTLKTYQDFLQATVCDPATPACYLQSCCPSCPGTKALEIK
ncbi:UPF0246 protein [Frankliniella fusca]|uniref:UPF0246 protein n=1 Tax=Frankliniella fusca TaxID=407009 RepID=A0AAE1GZ31_9NEOP|nr:UPF0246 protein [Frankliniella fusca]